MQFVIKTPLRTLEPKCFFFLSSFIIVIPRGRPLLKLTRVSFPKQFDGIRFQGSLCFQSQANRESLRKLESRKVKIVTKINICSILLELRKKKGNQNS